MAGLFEKGCTSCGAPIIWAESKDGKKIPLDAEPERRFVFVEGDMVRLVRTYTSHFATCENADQHRKPR